MNKKFIEVMDVIEQPKLDSVNPHYKSKFASLGECNRVVREACRKVGGCAFRQVSGYDVLEDGRLVWFIESLFCTESGEESLAKVPYNPDANPQKTGIGITYARRYCICTAFGLHGEEDTDGEAQPRQLTPQQQSYLDLRAAVARRMDSNVHDVQAVLDKRFAANGKIPNDRMGEAVAYMQAVLAAGSYEINVQEVL